MIFFNKNDHTPGEDHDEQYCTLGIHQKGGCEAKKCILELWGVCVRYGWYGIPTYVQPVHRHTMENQRKNADTHQY